jgi:hypothetical protein
MMVRVYRLRDKGRRLPGVDVEANGGSVGNLEMRQRAPRRNWYMAQLMTQDGSYIIPVLDQAHVIGVMADGMLIAGTEVIPRNDHLKSRVEGYRQSWWCVPVGDRHA